jgi:hypothetical protein
MAMVDLFRGGNGDYEPPDIVNDPGPRYDSDRGGSPPADGNYGLIPSGDINPETGFRWNSAEDLRELNKRYGGASGGQPVEDWLKQYQHGNQASEGLDRTLQGLTAAGYAAAPYMYGSTPSGNELTIDGQKRKIISENGGNPEWYDWGSIDNGGGGGGGGGSNLPWQSPNAYPGGSIFDDPATTDFMKLLMSRVNALNQPYTPPSLAPLTDYLKSYFQRLQGPAYTPQQLDLLQTQSLDPLSRERDSYRQRILDNASRRGLDPQSGIVQKMLSDADNQFEQIRTKTQAGFAAKAVDLDRINAQQAASVGQLLANIEQANFNANENRANQALDISKMVPDLARQRMLDANTILSGNQIDPTSLLRLQQGQDQFDSAQTQNYLLGLGQLLPYLLEAFGIGK